jgi:hypothetical protein
MYDTSKRLSMRTAGNFDLPDHDFLLLNCSTGPMECSTGNSYQAEALRNVLIFRVFVAQSPNAKSHRHTFYFVEKVFKVSQF